MNRLYRALFAGLLLVLPALADEPAVPPVPEGNWKVLLPSVRESNGQPTWLIQIEHKGGAWRGKALAKASRWPAVTVEKVVVTADKLSFTLKGADLVFPCEFRLVAGAEKLRGETSLRGVVAPVELERTTLTSLDSYDVDRETLAKATPGFEAVGVALDLLSKAEEKKVKLADVRSWAAKASKSAELYGPGWHRQIILTVAEILNGQKGYEVVALAYAQRAERQLDPKEPPSAQKRVLEVLAAALEKAGKAEDAKLVQARLKKLDFRVKLKTYPGRKTKSERVVLAELFTGSGCKPCVAVDLALESLAKTFEPTQLVVLNYHVHSPEPDPLACDDTENRAAYYKLRSVPTLFIDGAAASPGGGTASEAQDKYDDYFSDVSNELDKMPGVALKVQATKKGEKLTITAEASKLEKPAEEVKLRVVLVEEQVSYKGSNGLAVHHNVVRTLPDRGMGVGFKDKAAKATYTIDLEDLRKKRLAELEKAGEKRPFPTKERPLELKKLRVVAFVQDDTMGDVLQAAVAEVKSE